jgi:protein-S-isoprenylcysteine O-methyltransferase Ste14
LRRRFGYLRGHRFAWRVDHWTRRRRLEHGAFCASRLVVATAIVGVCGTFVEAGFACDSCRSAGGAVAFAASLSATTATTTTTATRTAAGALTAIALGSLLLTVAQPR